MAEELDSDELRSDALNSRGISKGRLGDETGIDDLRSAVELADAANSPVQMATAQNNLAQLSLLLNVNPEHAHELAEKLHQKDPTNPVFTSTYGFSLYVKGRSQQAVKVMSELKPDDLHRPAIAAYYGIFLVAAGDKSKAAEYLERGSEAPLLPEEKLLLANARNKIKATQP